jgi:glycosyltransferase involved in cell wall biosynthesis
MVIQREYGRSGEAVRLPKMPPNFRGAIADEVSVDSIRPAAGVGDIDRVVIINDFSTTNGGCTGLALLSLRLFQQLGVPVTYICGDEGDGRLASPDVELVALGGESILTANPGSSFVKGIHNAAADSMVARWIDAHDTPHTIYHVHGWAKILSPSIFVALSRVATRTVIHAHDFFLACPNGAFYDYPSEKPCNLQPLSSRCMATQCDKRNYAQKLWRAVRSARLRALLSSEKAPFRDFILIHEKMAPLFERSGFPAAALRTLRNPVVPFTGERVRAEENSEFFFIGRLDLEKGAEDVAKAAVQAGVRLNIIGDGPQAKSLAGYGENVRLLGWHTHQEIAARVRKARAVVLPTRYPEPFGLVALEASLSGIPVILSDKAYLADEMVSAGVAIACDTSNPTVFQATLRRVASMPREQIQAMSIKAFEAAVRPATTPNEWRDGLIEHYRNLLEQRDSV